MKAIATEHIVRLPDGIGLYTVVMLPRKGGQFPVILQRSPYVTKVVDLESMLTDACPYLRDGYAVVYQHVRGCGRSEGDFIPYENERADGLAVLDWLRQQPFSNGEVYLSGSSYLSSVHFSYLNAAPPEVRGALLAVQDCVRYNILFRNGFFKTGLHGSWFARVYKQNSLTRKNFCPDSFRLLPLSDFSRVVFGEAVPSFDEPLLHPDQDDPFWSTPAAGGDYLDAVRRSRIPLLLITAFNDIYTEGVIEMWNSMSAEQRARSALIITPYEHNTSYMPLMPVQFPRGGLKEVWPDYAINWFNHLRRGDALHFGELGKVTYYTMWENRWHSAPMLPQGKTPLTFFLNDHALDLEPGPTGEIQYLYNPYAPATFPGGCCLNFDGMRAQPPPNSRYDIVSFLSRPLSKRRVFNGGARARLLVRTDCEDTCFYVRLSVVKAGVAYGLRDDITAVSREHPDYRPGTAVALHFRFTPCSFMLEKGDQLRLDVSSSCAPHFSAHTNHKGLQYIQTTARVAHNTLLLGKSELTLFAD